MNGQPIAGQPLIGVVFVLSLSAFAHAGVLHTSTVALCAACMAGMLLAPSTTSPTKPESVTFAAAVVGAALPMHEKSNTNSNASGGASGAASGMIMICASGSLPSPPPQAASSAN